MNKIILFVVFIFIVISLFFGANIKNGTMFFIDKLIYGYDNLSTNIGNTFNNHFNQADEISRLRKQNAELKKSALLLSTFAEKLNGILSDTNSTQYSPNVELVKTLSYKNIGDYNKIWIYYRDFNTSKIYGLMKNGVTAGIAVSENERPLAILQNDPKCSFSVYIGNNKIPGVIKGGLDHVEIEYIPKWFEPKVGDEIYTSGLDNIFFSNVKVGKVAKVIDQDLYKSVIVKPYFKTSIPSYLYIIKREK